MAQHALTRKQHAQLRELKNLPSLPIEQQLAFFARIGIERDGLVLSSECDPESRAGLEKTFVKGRRVREHVFLKGFQSAQLFAEYMSTITTGRKDGIVLTAVDAPNK